MLSRTPRPNATPPVFCTAARSARSIWTSRWTPRFASVLTRTVGDGRTAFVVGATTGLLCGLGAFLAPRALPALETQAQALARATAPGELDELECIALDAAVRATEQTCAALSSVALPIARYVTLVARGALDLLLRGVDATQTIMARLHLHVALLNAFREGVVTWRARIATLPTTPKGSLVAGVTAADGYLRILKRLTTHPFASAFRERVQMRVMPCRTARPGSRLTRRQR
jgi:hypothetical protein